jgi:hypothetical protein
MMLLLDRYLATMSRYPSSEPTGPTRKWQAGTKWHAAEEEVGGRSGARGPEGKPVIWFVIGAAPGGQTLPSSPSSSTDAGRC